MAPMQSPDKRKRATADSVGPTENWKQRAVQAEWVRDEWAHQNEELRARYQALRSEFERAGRELAQIQASPGWKIIESYRRWRLRHIHTNPVVKNVVEPSMRWLLRTKRLSAGNAESAIHLTAAAGKTTTLIQAGVINQPPQSAYSEWLEQNTPSAAVLQAQRLIGRQFCHRPVVSVITPVYKISTKVLKETIASVTAQSYENWELCISHADPENADQRNWLLEQSAAEPRIKLALLSMPQGISANSNHALELATGVFSALLDHDDALTPNALFEVVELLNREPDLNFIYSDKDQIDEDSRACFAPLFKPEWSPEVMLSANYLTHLCVMRTEHIREVGGWRSETDGAQDWDLFLRIIDQYGKVRHLPKVLYHWRQVASSVSVGGLRVKPYVASGQVRTVTDHCARMQSPAEVKFGERQLNVSFPPRKRVEVALMFLRRGGVNQPPAFLSHPLVTVACRVVRVDDDLLARLEPVIASSAASIVVLIDEAVSPASQNWLIDLIGPLQKPAIGLSGAMLLDPSTGNLKQCGVVFDSEGQAQSIYSGRPEHVSEAFGPASWYRNWSAVTGACIAMRREVWDHAMAIRETPLHPRFDFHLCFTATHRLGKRVLYNPHVRLFQKNPAFLDQFLLDQRTNPAESVKAILPNGDPYFHRQLDCFQGQIEFKTPISSAGEKAHVLDYAAESRVLANVFDYSARTLEHSRLACESGAAGRIRTITWFIPEIESPFYGGLHTILRFADSFRATHGIRSTFCVIARVKPERTRSLIALAFPELAATSAIYSMAYDQVEQLPPTDAAVSTLWTTAYAALHFNKTSRKFYFIQDDEALFYPAGSTAALAEATYRFGFRGICNTTSLLKRYRERGGEGEYFTPCIDREVFHSRGRKPHSARGPFTLFCYGRPAHARNSFELLAAVLRELKRRLRGNIVIYNAGAEWDARAYGLQNTALNLGALPYRTTAALYRACDAGLVIMMTRHPSYLPLELMGCGSLVITNRNTDTNWLLSDEENCLLAEPAVSALADRVEEGLSNHKLRSRVAAQGEALAHADYADWQTQIQKIHRFMLS